MHKHPAMNVLLPLALVSSLALATSCVPDDGPEIPQADRCSQAGDDPVTLVEMGQGTLESLFEPWLEGQSVFVEYGPQGGAMIAFRMRAEGSDDTCLAFSMRVTNAGGTVIMDDSFALRLYRQDDDSLVSETNFGIFNGEMDPRRGELLDFEVSLGGMSLTRTLEVAQ